MSLITLGDEENEVTHFDGAGQCAMYDNCGKKSVFGQELPCPDQSPARNTTADLRNQLQSICGSSFSDLKSACCTPDQLTNLAQSLLQAEPLISSCPACRNNFRQFYCHFTCSPQQSTFVNVTQTQTVTNTKTGKPNQAIKSVDFYVDPQFGLAFFNSCKDVKFGATNGFVLDLIAGGASTWIEFLRYMGQERPGLGSPFQINFPTLDQSNLISTNLNIQDTSKKQNDKKQLPSPSSTYYSPFLNSNQSITPLNPVSLQCDSQSLDARCACADCPSVCTSLPPPPAPFIPPSGSSCRIGQVNCLDFSLILIYALALSSSVIFIIWKDIVRTRKHALAARQNGDADSGYETPSGYERVSMHDPLAPNLSSGASPDITDGEDSDDEAHRTSSSARPILNPLVGASSMADTAHRFLSRGSQPISSPNTNNSFFSPHRLGRGAPLLVSDTDTRLMATHHHQPRSYPLNVLFSRLFYHFGFKCASKPYLTIAIGLVACGALNAGWSRFEIEKEPVKLWVPENSQSAIEKRDFESRFGPFYRTEQIFFSSLDQDEESVLTYERLKWIAQFEADVRALKSPNGLSLTSVCLAPTSAVQPPKSASDCVVESIMGYYSNSLSGINEDNWAKRLDACAASPTGCLPAFGQPLSPQLVLGGIPHNTTSDRRMEASRAKAVIITYVVNNYLESTQLEQAKEWETVLKTYLESISNQDDLYPRDRWPASVGLKMDWSTEISLEGEINQSTNTDIPIVVLSYVAMFLYVAINLGGSASAIFSACFRALSSLVKLAIPNVLRFSTEDRHGHFPSRPSPSLKRQLLVESKFMLALWSILIVLASVSTSIGFFSMLGIKTTLIIAEVIPFLVLAIGVDNVFLLSNELSRQNAKAYKALARSGIGGFGDASEARIDEDDDSEGEMDGLPKVEVRIGKAISRVGPSVLLSASCETVAFALGAIVGMPAVRNFAIYAAGAVAINTILQMTVFVSVMAIDMHRMEANRVDCVPCLKLDTHISTYDMAIASGEGNLASFIRTIYAPLLVKRPLKIFIISLFSGLFVFSMICARRIELGLDQRLALPPNSHLIGYFDALDQYLEVGAPVYFVAEDLNVTARDGQQALCGRFSTCQDGSLANVIEAERKRSSSSYIALPPAVWIDDFFQWLNPALELCCRVKRKDPKTFCSERDRERDCEACFASKKGGWNVTMEGFPEGEEFMWYLQQWLKSPTTESCPLGGRAAYYDALSISSESVQASNFRTSHTPLKAQADYINAMVSARRIAEDLSTENGGRVYPYSIFYVFFEQYLNIRSTSFNVIFLALAAVFVVSSTLLGSLRTGGVMTMTVGMMVMNMLGGMGMWNVSLNAISLVNLVIGVGIGVEFCSHVARAFVGANGGGLPQSHPHGQRDRDERVCLALSDVGGSVFAGIFSTKIIGISVLGLTRSKLLEIYYFRMWLILMISGVIHSLVFLPIALSFVGGQGHALDDDLDLAVMVNGRYEAEQRALLEDDADEDDEDY